VKGRQAGAALFPLVLQVQGGASPDGGSLLVEAATGDGEMLRFAVASTDVQQFVAFLLCRPACSIMCRARHVGDDDHVGVRVFLFELCGLFFRASNEKPHGISIRVLLLELFGFLWRTRPQHRSSLLL